MAKCKITWISSLTELSLQFADAVLHCGGRDFQCHKAILAARSQVFEAMFKYDMEEKKSSRVEVKDCEPEVTSWQLPPWSWSTAVPWSTLWCSGDGGDVAVHLHWENTSLLGNNGQRPVSSRWQVRTIFFNFLETHPNASLTTNHRYALERLKVMCEEALCTGLTIDNVSDVLILADLHSAEQLKAQVSFDVRWLSSSSWPSCRR